MDVITNNSNNSAVFQRMKSTNTANHDQGIELGLIGSIDPRPSRCQKPPTSYPRKRLNSAELYSRLEKRNGNPLSVTQLQEKYQQEKSLLHLKDMTLGFKLWLLGLQIKWGIASPSLDQ